MTLNLVIGRFFTAKLGDYTAVMLSRKLTNTFFIVSNVFWRSLGHNFKENVMSTGREVWLVIIIAAVLSVAISFALFGHGIHLLNVFVVLLTVVLSVVLMTLNYFVTGPGCNILDRILVAIAYVFVVWSAFVVIVAPPSPPPAMPYWMHALAWATIVGAGAGILHWIFGHRDFPPRNP